MNILHKCIVLIISMSLMGCSIQKTNLFLEPFNHYQTLILYDDPFHYIDFLNTMIQSRLPVDIYNINDDIPSVDNYDLILIGNYVSNDEPTEALLQFLNDYDLKEKNVSCFWIGAMNNPDYETCIQSHLYHADYHLGIGFNHDEISERELVGYMMDEWLSILVEECDKELF